MERRKEDRQSVVVPVWIEGPASLIPCTLTNLSLRGGELGISMDFALPKQFAVRLTEDGKIRRGCNLVWRREDRAGVSFFQLNKATRQESSFAGA
jgi:hypothetical protein